ncbi:MAG TPA: helix-turn-helix domain-containing protein [Gemmatimonadales bacterium]|nr:helix-turn-helix domain-containing protein [Gemmatimonadales bacterium]
MQSSLTDTAIPANKSDVPSTSMRADSGHVEHECMTAHELASLLRVNRKTVYEYAARHVIPCRRLGRRLVFSRPVIRAWLARSSGTDFTPLHRKRPVKTVADDR